MSKKKREHFVVKMQTHSFVPHMCFWGFCYIIYQVKIISIFTNITPNFINVNNIKKIQTNNKIQSLKTVNVKLEHSDDSI